MGDPHHVAGEPEAVDGGGRLNIKERVMAKWIYDLSIFLILLGAGLGIIWP